MANEAGEVQSGGKAEMIADFWDVVRISEYSTRVPVRGKLGYINGLSEVGESCKRSISLWIYDLDIGWCVEEEALILLGYKDEIARADMEQRRRAGLSMRIGVDPTTGEGFLSD